MLPGRDRRAPRAGACALLASLLLACSTGAHARFELDASVQREVTAHAGTVRDIVDAATRTHANDTFDSVAELCDRFGHRLLGSAALEDATDWLLARLSAEGLSNVHAEVAHGQPRWTRGNESAVLTSPLMGGGRAAALRVLALGSSVGGDVEAPVVVARDWRELDALGAEGKLAGAIVLLNPVWRGYGETVQYRVSGASRAAAHGAVAVLVRSVTPFSLGNPHTGLGSDSGGPTPIPAAALATEDADMLARMAARGWAVRVRLSLGAATAAETTSSRVVVAELPGTDLAHQVVLLSGHLDSWDVGQGALDDGAGMAIGWRALALLSKLGLRPRRTLRFVAWSGEEWGTGSAAYWAAHAGEAANITLAAESDSGVFAPAALRLAAPVAAHALARAVGRLLTDADAAGGVTAGGEGADISAAMQLGVPGASLETRAAAWFRDRGEWNASGIAGRKFQGDYFMYHHSVADTPSLLDPAQLDAALATWASFAFVFANLTLPMPRGAPAGDAQLAAELGAAASTAPPPVCGPGWEPPAAAPRGGNAGGLGGAQIALIAVGAAIAGAGLAWLALVPLGAHGHRHAGWEAVPSAPRVTPPGIPVAGPTRVVPAVPARAARATPSAGAGASREEEEGLLPSHEAGGGA